MIRVRAVSAGVAAALALAAPSMAEPTVPDDTPWTVDDANPGRHPNSIEEILSRDHNAEDQDIAPPGLDPADDQPGAPAALSEDRLMPKLPDKIEPAHQHVPDAAVKASEPGAAQAPQPGTAAATPPASAPGDKARGFAPPQGQAKPANMPAQPVAASPGIKSPVQSAPGEPAQAQTSSPTVPSPAQTSAPVAGSQPPQIIQTAPTPPALRPQPPASTATAHEEREPTPPAPAAAAEPSPSTPQVEQTAVQVPGKLYLPLKRYFETRSNSLEQFDPADKAALSAFYEKTVGEPLWVTKDGFNDAGKSLIAEIGKADDWGLAGSDYPLPALIAKSGEFSFEDLADAEVRLSLAAMLYARHARGDRIDTPSDQLSSYIDRKPQTIEPPKLIEALVAAPDKAEYLRALHPKHPQFERLRQKLIALRQQQRDGTEPEKIPAGPKITPGKENIQVALVRRRLGVPVPTVKADGSAANDTYFDEALARAVMDYKTKHQIEPVNATITDALRASFNQGADIDEDRLLANMEQWRWMPQDMGETHVWVNIPEFLVRVIKSDHIVHEERVVTGRYETQTPIFSNTMKTVVFQPSWNVPESIKVNELLPKLRAGANPIEGQGLKIERNGREISAWDIDWGRQDIRNFHIFQPPGDSNVLGVVKFLFPNKHSVYLHDTPSKRLFNEKVRTFSHGCMRVRNPVRLAEVIMAEDKGWDKQKVDELVSSGPPDNDVALDHPIPVHVTYFTMWVNDDGSVQTFGDVYGHEKRIKLGLHGRWNEIEKNPDHLAPPDPSAVASREDWGDQDEDSQRRPRRVARDYNDEEPRRGRAFPAPEGKQARIYKSKPSFGDFISKIFGGN